MREVVIQAWCDNYHEDAPALAKRVLTASLDDGQTLRLDLCDPCWQALVGPWEGLLAEHGAKPDSSAPAAPPKSSKASPAKADPGVCPICGQQAAWLGMHVTTAHGVTLPEDNTCPTCGEVFTSVHQLGRHHTAEHGRPTKHALADQLAAQRRHPAGRKRPRKASA